MATIRERRRLFQVENYRLYSPPISPTMERSNAMNDLIDLAARVSLSDSPGISSQRGVSSPATPLSPTPALESRTPRRRLLMESTETTPVLSPSTLPAGPSQFPDFHRALASKLLGSTPPLNPLREGEETKVAMETRFVFPRSSSLNADKSQTEGDLTVPVSPIYGDVTSTVSHQRHPATSFTLLNSACEESLTLGCRDSGLGSPNDSSICRRRKERQKTSSETISAPLISQKIIRCEENSNDSLLDMEDFEKSHPAVPAPSSIASLIRAPLLYDAEGAHQRKRPQQKRSLAPGKDTVGSPKLKRRKSGVFVVFPSSGESDCAESNDLQLPDGSGLEYALPVVAGRHPDLKSISGHTLSDLLDGFYDDDVSSFRVIDSRYPYEHEGGHIRDAANAYTEREVAAMLEETGDETDGRRILVFHCEFSAERGPRLMRFLRKVDRAANVDSYPRLKYPELYLLEGGYKEFFEGYRRHCRPQSYVRMTDENHAEEMRFFRRKSKSENAVLGSITNRTGSKRFKL